MSCGCGAVGAGVGLTGACEKEKGEAEGEMGAKVAKLGPCEGASEGTMVVSSCEGS